jgi:hypothetical protein
LKLRWRNYRYDIHHVCWRRRMVWVVLLLLPPKSSRGKKKLTMMIEKADDDYSAIVPYDENDVEHD